MDDLNQHDSDPMLVAIVLLVKLRCQNIMVICIGCLWLISCIDLYDILKSHIFFTIINLLLYRNISSKEIRNIIAV